MCHRTSGAEHFGESNIERSNSVFKADREVRSSHGIKIGVVHVPRCTLFKSVHRGRAIGGRLAGDCRITIKNGPPKAHSQGANSK
jgi:hypothetical protein